MLSNEQIQSVVDELIIGVTEPEKGWSLNESATCCVYWCLVHKAWRDGEKLHKKQALEQLRRGALANRSRGSIEAKSQNVTFVAQSLLDAGLGIYHSGRYAKRGSGKDLGPMVCKGYTPASHKQKVLEDILPKALGYFDLIIEDSSSMNRPQKPRERVVPQRKTRDVKCWLMLKKPRATILGDGYDDATASHYSWDNTVPNHRMPSASDYLVLWDGDNLIGASVIENVEQGEDSKTRYRCAKCKKTKLQPRETKRPKYKCGGCKEESDNPVEEIIRVSTYRAIYPSAWLDLNCELSSAKLRDCCIKPKSIHSIREMSWDAFQKELRCELGPYATNILERQHTSVSGGHRETLVRVRIGQAAFRKELLNTYGATCALSGPAPKEALDAAHLYSYAELGDHDVFGGLLIRKDLHCLFDRGLILINPNTLRLKIDESISNYAQYVALHEREIQVNLTAKSVAWIRLHWDQHVM